MSNEQHNATVYKSAIGWWIPALVILTASTAFLGPLIDGEIFWVGLLLGLWLAIMEIVMFASVRYQICDGKFGVRNIFYRWEWYPIEKIAEVKETTGILSAPALSARRLAIIFSDRAVMKSSMPLEISPSDRTGFIAQLKALNPAIEVK